MDDGCIIAFDFGLRHTGVAIGQTLTGTARGVATLEAIRGKTDWRRVLALVEDYEPLLAVVGLPLNMDGSRSDMAALAQRFAQQLGQRTRMRTVMHDERLTSRSTTAELKYARAAGQASTGHELAACLILESWLRQRGADGAASNARG